MLKYNNIDLVEVFALVLLAVGVVLIGIGWVEGTHASSELTRVLVEEWTPGFVIDGLLLFAVNRIIRRNERKRVLAQLGSLSNEFALDAVRLARTEGWLMEGEVRGSDLQRARLANSDLSEADLTEVNLRYADLRAADLTHAQLVGADLTGANLAGADLRWANLTNAQLGWANLRDTRLQGALTEGADAAYAAVDDDFEALTTLNGGIEGGHLSPEQVVLIRTTFESVEAIGTRAIDTFYEKLFAAHPSLTSMFAGSKTRQSRKFLQSLRTVVYSLEAPERSIHTLEQLGRRHVGYGVEPGHYDAAGAVLLDTFAEVLPNFGDAEREAWAAAYRMIADVMLYASRDERGEAGASRAA